MDFVRESLNENFIKGENKLNSLDIGLIRVIRNWMNDHSFNESEYEIKNNIVYMLFFVSMNTIKSVFIDKPPFINVDFNLPVSKLMYYILLRDFKNYKELAEEIDFKTIGCNTVIMVYIIEHNLIKYGKVLLNNQSFISQCRKFFVMIKFEEFCKNDDK
jgi:hypothetical protein